MWILPLSTFDIHIDIALFHVPLTTSLFFLLKRYYPRFPVCPLNIRTIPTFHPLIALLPSCPTASPLRTFTNGHLCSLKWRGVGHFTMHPRFVSMQWIPHIGSSFAITTQTLRCFHIFVVTTSFSCFLGHPLFNRVGVGVGVGVGVSPAVVVVVPFDPPAAAAVAGCVGYCGPVA